MKNILCMPRLDVTFKKGPVPIERSAIPPIRLHWLDFKFNFLQAHKNTGNELIILENPLWQFTPEMVSKLSKEYDNVFMPHKQKVDFDVGDNVYYYMQTVFPEYFTIDKKGWGGNLSYLPLDIKDIDYTKSLPVFKKLQERIKYNISKFNQPNYKYLDEEDFWLFVCQIPHDETIKYHSKVSVNFALEQTIIAAKTLNKKLIVKGHPVNPGSMQELKETCRKNNILYIEEYSIHQCLSQCSHVFLVNSGVGFEAMLHEKPIFRFGEAEYSQIIPKVENCDDILSKIDYDFSLSYPNFIYKFIETSYNSKEIESFVKFFNET